MKKMLNRKLTLFFLCLSYVLVLGHSILPHDHHEEDLLINTAQFHPAEENSNSDDFNLPDMFHNYYHPGEKEIFTTSHFSQLVYTFKTKFHSNYYKNDILIIDNSPPLLLPPDKSVTNFKKILYSYSGLRAPPLS